MIQGFGDRATERFFVGERTPKAWERFEAIARRKLDAVNAAIELADLRVPPGNRLEALRGDMQGLHSIRINDRLRVLFRWTEAGPDDVRISDHYRE